MGFGNSISTGQKPMTDKTFETKPGSDSDAQLAALFAPLRVRPALLALHAWHDEIAGLPLRIREPAIGAMRMEWHRDAIRDAFADTPNIRRNPLIEGIASLKDAAGAPDADQLLAIVDAYDAGFEGQGFANVDGLLAYVDQTEGAVLRMAARLIDPVFSDHEKLVQVGRALGGASLLRIFALRAARGLGVIPADALTHAGLSTARLASGQEPDKAKAALISVIELAQEALDLARGDVRALPPELFPAWGAAALVPGYLKQARKVADPYRNAVTLSPLSKRLTLMKASLTGRI